MKKIYFVRHGESLWNVENKICGATDIPLTEKGHLQAIETGKAILESKIKADLILYSPLSRAAETARHISEVTGIPAKQEILLTEQNFGHWEGTPRNSEEFKKARAQFVQNYGSGESMMRLAQRVYNLLDRLKQDEKTYILVAHNGISRVVNSYFYEMTNEEYSMFGISNAEIKTYEFPQTENSVQKTPEKTHEEKQMGGYVTVYTDGGCSGNPGPGGWGCVLIYDGDARQLSGGEHSTTNNRMELTAAINALSAIYNTPQFKNLPVKVFIDSQYVKNGITGWINNWKKNGWKTVAKKPVLNQDLWQKLDALACELNVEWNWVKGHAGVEYNEVCDQLCQQEIAKHR